MNEMNGEIEALGRPALEIALIETNEHLEQFNSLLDHSFGLEDGRHFLDDFPVWDSLYSSEVVRIGIFEAERLVSAAGVRLAELKIGQDQLKVAIVGAVCSAESHRGRGLASSIVTFANDWATQEGAAAVFLWGSEYTLYQKLGFELCGLQVRTALSGRGLESLDVSRVERGWDDRIFNLLASRTGGLKISQEDQKWYREHKNVDWRYIESQGKLIAYGALGRGIDLPHVVHEWGGDAEALNEVLASFLQEDGESQIIGSPDLMDRYQFAFKEDEVEFLSLCRIIDPEKIMKVAYPDVESFAKRSKGEWTITFSGKTFSGLTALEVGRFFFGPGAVVPIPIWIWGLDAA